MRGILDGSVYMKQEAEEQQLRLGGNSWSINLQDLPEEATLIEYITPLTHYVITREKAFKRGFVKVFNGEKKLVVPIKYWYEGVAINEP